MTKKTTLLMIAIIVALSGLAGCDQKNALVTGIAVVNIDQVLRDSTIGKQEADHDKQVQALLLKIHDEANKAYANLPAEEQQKSRAADAETLNRQWLAEQNAARQISLKVIANAVSEYRQEKKLLLVVDSQNVIARDDSTDITADIVSRLEKTQVSYDPMPSISVKTPERAPAKSETPAVRKTSK